VSESVSESDTVTRLSCVYTFFLRHTKLGLYNAECLYSFAIFKMFFKSFKYI